MNIYLENCKGYLRFNYESKYARGSFAISNIGELIHAIEEVCGKGSFCLYQGKNEFHPKAIEYSLYKEYEGKWPQITYWQQGVKTQVIEQARDIARQVWGDIPELQIGWLENRLCSYVEDIQE